ncbi:MAG: PD40 domain-containing protein, partial [Silvibacterium sp.]|nr:PD40 domain-containing protein [Silvibacterium sp.]
METRSNHRVRFKTFELDLSSRELRRNSVRLKLQGQPVEVLAMLLERPGEVVTRDEMRRRLWPEDAFVDFEHSLNSAVRRLREALGDNAEDPRFVETLPRLGYRFIAPVQAAADGAAKTPSSQNGQGVLAAPDATVKSQAETPQPTHSEETPNPHPKRRHAILAACCACILLLGAVWFVYYRWRVNIPAPPVQRALTRLTSDDGLQTGATWSPDGRYIAYASDHGGKFDIWVQQINGGDPIQITKGPGQNWQPDWSPDGQYIAYRSEEGDGGIYITPALGGVGQQRKIASFGFYPKWSPDSLHVLFFQYVVVFMKRAYVVGLDGGSPREVLTDLGQPFGVASAAWHPDGKRITAWITNESPIPNFSTEPVDGGA